LIRQGNLAEAARLAGAMPLPLSQARVALAQGDPAAALTILEPLRQEAEARGWHNDRLRTMVLQALAHHATGDTGAALQMISDALAEAEPEGFVRRFVDEGPPMACLLTQAAAQGMMPGYVAKLLGTFETEKQTQRASSPAGQPLIEPLSERELEVLRLIAQGLSNEEISQQLFLALSTVKGHNQRLFDKLGVQRRTEAVARARELALL
jgi:LuxR family maltose regulon positive regulatory protein